MSEEILDALFYGGLSAGGRKVHLTPEHLAANDKLKAVRDYLTSKLSEDNLQALEELDDLYTESSSLLERDSFGYGFRLGVMLMAEVFLTGESLPPE